jgi:hypothetical protein
MPLCLKYFFVRVQYMYVLVLGPKSCHDEMCRSPINMVKVGGLRVSSHVGQCGIYMIVVWYPKQGVAAGRVVGSYSVESVNW